MQESAQFFNDTGVSMSMQGFHNEAIACLKKGLALEPDNSLMWLNLGLSYYAAKRQNDSKFALFQSLKYNPYEADAWDSLGLVLFETIGLHGEPLNRPLHLTLKWGMRFLTCVIPILNWE